MFLVFSAIEVVCALATLSSKKVKVVTGVSVVLV
jgi:hypothetical protein